MTKAALHALSAEGLVALFVRTALEQDEAVLVSDVKNTNRLYRELKAIERELRFRPGDQRRALVRLFDHPNPQVQVKAAKATLAVVPTAARHVLEMVAETCVGPQKLEAGMSLSNLDAGIYKPT